MIVATVLTVYGIETCSRVFFVETVQPIVATVLTVYGIETFRVFWFLVGWFIGLQQYLPFTVLKPNSPFNVFRNSDLLQQYLPFTVLKHCRYYVLS